MKLELLQRANSDFGFDSSFVLRISGLVLFYSRSVIATMSETFLPEVM